jgi:O-antigen/teichoic acid export membrane protein
VSERKGTGRFVRDTMQVFGGQVTMTVIGMITGIITARWLGPTDRGLFQLLTLAPVFLSNFVKLGIPQANVYYMRRENADAGDVAGNSIWLAVGLGLLLTAVCWFERDWVSARILKGAPPYLLLPVLAVTPFVLMQAYFLGIAQAQERFREYNIQQIAPNVFSLVGMTVALILLHQGLIGAVLIQLGIVLFVSLWLVVRIHRHSPIHLRPKIGLMKQMLGFGSKSYLQTLAATLHLRIDQYMIAYFLTPKQVGYYAIAVNLTNLLLRIPDATGTVLFPRLAGASETDAHRATTQVCRHTLFLAVTGSLIFLVVGPIGIPILYGKAFAPAVVALVILLPAVVMLSLYLILTRNFTSRGKQEINVVAAAVGLAMNVGTNWMLIPRFGIAGAAFSSFVSYGTAATILLVAFVRESGHGVRDTLVLRRKELDQIAKAAWRGGRALAGS